MSDESRAKEQLLEELDTLRGLVAEMEGALSEHRRAEDDLRASERRYRELADSLPGAVYEMDPTGRLTFGNSVGLELFGYTLADFDRGLNAIDLIAPEDRDRAVRNIGEVMRGKPTAAQEYLGLRKDGSTFPVAISSNPLLRDGVAIGLRGFVMDISEHKREEASRLRLAAIVESSEDAIIGADLDGIITDWNSGAERMYGFKAEEAVGKPLSIVIPPELAGEVPHFLACLRRGERMRLHETVGVRKDGSLLDLSVIISPILDGLGRAVGSAAISRDISEQKRAEAEREQAEQALRKSEAHLAEAQRMARVGSYQWSVMQRESHWSAEMFRILGLTANEMLSAQEFIQLVHPEDRFVVEESLRRVLKEAKPVDVEFRIVPPGGSVKHIRATAELTLNDAGVVESVSGFFMDITERREMDQQLLRAQRLEAAGRVAGQVAHDFANLMSPLAVYPDLIKMQLPEGHRAIAYCDGLLEAVQDMAEINSDLLTLARRAHVNREAIDLSRVVRQAVEGMLMDRPDTLLVRLELDHDLPSIIGGHGQLLRAISNLIANARDAMGDRGVLGVKTERVGGSLPLGIPKQNESGEYIRVIVSDTGPGIPPEHQPRVFDAFFTTKRADRRRGSGLGLTIVQSVIEDHNGYLQMESQVGKGTSFSLYFPVCLQVRKTPGVEALRTGTERVLVVDDDPLQRKVIGELLTQLGYRVEVVSSGEIALEALKEHPVDLVILDMVLPGGMDGAETYRRIHEIRPGQRAILLSAYAETDRVRMARQMGAETYLRKPITLAAMARAVRELLDKAG